MPQHPQDNVNAMLVVLTTLPNLKAAKDLAGALVEVRLAACVQIQEGVRSIYRWEGKVCDEQEVLLSAKTDAAKWLEISSFIKEKHPYELPEILAFSPVQFDQHYGQWVRSEVNS
jgi:periplasmic divalent cation tolerance protein